MKAFARTSATAVLLLGAALAPRSAWADEPGAELGVALLTMGPGSHPFTKFGHDALLVHDQRTGTAWVYNYGTFAFDSPWLIVDFLRGRFRYWLSVAPLARVIEQYGRDDRSIVAQELELTPSEKRGLADFLEHNARGENKYYKYDYYRDNCATRVRDAIDHAVGGRLHEAARSPARMTFREHTLRLTAGDPLLYLGLDVAMGNLIDQPITIWDEMFLPERVEESVRNVTVPGPNGGEQPLVRAEHTLLAARRPPARAAPPAWGLPLLAAGVGLGGTLAGLGALSARGSRSARVLLGALLGVLGLGLGILGCLLAGLWAFTDHQVTHRNENVLQCTPLALALVLLGVGLARGRAPHLAAARMLTTALAVVSALGLLMKALPTFDQGNLEIIALALPLWSGAALSLHLAARARP